MAHYSSRRLSRNQDMSFSEGIGTIAGDALGYIFANVPPDELHSGLSKAIKTAPSLIQMQLDTLLQILKAANIRTSDIAESVAASDNERHCVRCHRSYLEKSNGLAACTIPHDPAMPHPRALTDIYFPCCGVSVGPQLPPAEPHCYRGRHTTVVRHLASNNTNIRPCSWHLNCFPAGNMPDMAASGGLTSTLTATTSEFDAVIQHTFAEVERDNMSLSPTATEFADNDTMEDYMPPARLRLSATELIRTQYETSTLAGRDGEDSGYTTS